MMHSANSVASKKDGNRGLLSKTERFSVFYHDIFDYPLTFADLIKWNASINFPVKEIDKAINFQDDYYFLVNRQSLIYKRVLRKRTSAMKMQVARKASVILSFIPSVKMVAVTGSLAMENAIDESDIDLIIVTKKGMLWTTRLLVYFLLFTFHFSLRRPTDRVQKDKLCLNMWLDEGDLTWPTRDRNIYTAHEIAQISPLVNKNKTYEKFLYKNTWLLKYWPNAVRVSNLESKILSSNTKFKILDSIFLPLEKFCYWFQKNYMKSKLTREVVSKTRAIFHPNNWGKVILSRLRS